MEGGVAFHAVAHRETARSEPLHVGNRADADQDRVGGDHPATGQMYACDPAVGGEHTFDEGVGLDSHSVRGVDFAEHRAELVPECIAHRLGDVGDERDLAAEVTGDRCRLGADEPAADHDQTWLASQFFTQGERVLRRTQHVDACDAVGPGQPSGASPGGDHEGVVADPVAVGERDLAGLGVERDGGAAEP